MPTTPRKARILLKEGKAKVVKRTPFAVQLLYPTGENKQRIYLGVDPGYQHVGLSAVGEKRELFAAEAELRTDIPRLMRERSVYRRNRRNRKTRYRPARWRNRTKSKGWLAPSIQHKLDSHARLVAMVKKLLPVARVVVEIAKFDIQKIKYKQGPLLGYWNVREYVLHRDGHKCRACKGKSKDRHLNAHHITFRSRGGSDRPDNLVTLCRTCHDQYHAGDLQLKLRQARGFAAETFMSLVWKKLGQTLRCKGNYGYNTKARRKKLRLPKTHINDAFVLGHGTNQPRCQQYRVKQVRKQNRKLYKGRHSETRNTAPRFVHGFQRYDKVRWNGRECFVVGRRVRGDFELKTLSGDRVYNHAKARDCIRLESSATFLVETAGFALNYASGCAS